MVGGYFRGSKDFLAKGGNFGSYLLPEPLVEKRMRVIWEKSFKGIEEFDGHKDFRVP